MPYTMSLSIPDDLYTELKARAKLDDEKPSRIVLKALKTLLEDLGDDS
jgi:hypothetical protein